MLNRVKSSGLQPKTIAPATRITMELKVFNTRKDSTTGTMVTLPRRYSSVEETITQVLTKAWSLGIIQSIRFGSSF